MSLNYSDVVEKVKNYYDSDDADNFYYHIWGGKDIHIGCYKFSDESIAIASERTVNRMCSIAQDNLKPEAKILDLGSGYGGSARHIVNQYGCHVSCLNLSQVQNKRNLEMNSQQQVLGRINVIDGSFEEIPLENNQFDLVWSQDAILHSGHREKVMSEINRVLKPGGYFIFTDPMQADDCPKEVLKPVLERIHLDSLGSFKFYRKQAELFGWREVAIDDQSQQLTNHYQHVKDTLIEKQGMLSNTISATYIEHMIQGLQNWIDAGNNGYLTWGIMYFQK